MTKVMKKDAISNWQIVDGTRAGVCTFDPDARFVIGTYKGLPIRTSQVVHNGAPNYVETCNSIYPLGMPYKAPEAPLTPKKGQAVAVVKQALIDGATRDDDLIVKMLGEERVNAAAQDSAKDVVRALMKAGLLA